MEIHLTGNFNKGLLYITSRNIKKKNSISGFTYVNPMSGDSRDKNKYHLLKRLPDYQQVFIADHFVYTDEV